MPLLYFQLQISDEDQTKFAIYRTEIGQFAIGSALTDEELFDLYRDRGDQTGNLKLLVSHTSATVHEIPYDHIPASTVNTIPPPVLPRSTYGPLRPNPNARMRQGSQSSTSEHHDKGYEPSVSDDDQDTFTRDRVHTRALPTPVQPPVHRAPSPAGYHRSRSPANILSPDRYSPEASSAIDSSPPLGSSPKSSRFVDEPRPLAPMSPEPHSAHTPDLFYERERSHTNDGQFSGSRRTRDRDGSDRRQRNGRKDCRPTGIRNHDQDSVDSKRGNESWTMIPTDVPTSGYYKDRPTTPQERSNRGFPVTPSSILSPYRSPPGASGGTGETSSRRKPLKVPVNWAVTWRPPSSKQDHKSAQSPSGSGLMRHGAKSMTDMRGAYNKHPPSLTPGRSRGPAPQPPLPVNSRPSTGGGPPGGPPLPGVPSTGDHTPTSVDHGPSPDISRSALSPSTSYSRPIATSATSYVVPPNVNGYLGSTNEPHPRPHSALGDSSPAPYTQPRYVHSPQHSEGTLYEGSLSRFTPGSAHGYGTSVPTFPRRDDVSRAQVSLHGDVVGERFARGPRTPPRSPIHPSTSAPNQNGFPEGGFVSGDVSGAAFVSRGAIDEDSQTSGSQTIRPDDRKWAEGFIDEHAIEGGTARPRQKSQLAPIPRLPTPPTSAETSTLSSGSNTIVVNEPSFSEDDSDDSDSDRDRGTIWAKKPSKDFQQSANAQKTRFTGRPPLPPLSIESSPSSGPTPLPANGNYDYVQPVPNGYPSPPPFIPTPRTPRRTGATKKSKEARVSKFDNNFEATWAPRPRPEDMYEQLEDWFPEHDLDKPVIDAPSGGTSPTTAEAPAPTPRRIGHKKSIRVVVAEHKRNLDRRSRADNSAVAATSRKRHTKLWGSKLEEVTTEQGKGPLSSTSADSSPGGGAKRECLSWFGHGVPGGAYTLLSSDLPLGPWRTHREGHVRPRLPGAERHNW